MKSLTVFIVLTLSLISVKGCWNFGFGEDEETTTPNEKQVSRCIAEMYLNPSIKLTPLGYKLQGSGIDDSIWFKFKTDSTDLSLIFDTSVVDISQFQENFSFSNSPKGINWWDVTAKNLLGAEISLPYVRYMNVGIEKKDDSYIIYIHWYEM